MDNVGYAALQIIPSFKGFEGQLERGTSGSLSSAGTKGGAVFGDAAGKSAGSRFGNVFKNAAKASLIGLAGAGALAVKFGADAVSAASDLEESTNKVQQVFGDAADSVFKYTEAAGDALGQTNTQAREAAATFGIFGKAAGLSDQKSAKFAKRMTTLASDLASFNNTSPEDAVQALGAALRGESEPIRAYGVLLDEAALKAEAMSLGILEPVRNENQISAYFVEVTRLQKDYNQAVKENGAQSIAALDAESKLGLAKDKLQKATEGTIPPLTQQQKLLAAQSAIFKQTEVAQGDFARTSDGLANQQRRLSARFENAKAALGQGLLPIMTDAADFLLDKGIPAFEDFAEWFTDKGIPKLKEFGGFVEDDVLPVLKDLAEFAGDAAEFMGGLIGQFNKLPGEAKLTALGVLLTGGAALKVKGRGGGALGTAGRALGLAKPIPVFVTNPGGLGGGVGGGKGGPVPVGALPKGSIGNLGKVGALTLGGATLGVTLASGAGVLEKQAIGDDQLIAEIQAAYEAGKLSLGEYQQVLRETGLAARVAADEAAAAFAEADLPTELKTQIAITGVPESRRAVKDLIAQYDLTPAMKRTTFEIFGYDLLMDRAKRIDKALDWAARDRRARISVEYEAQGYETRGGLQRGGGTTTTQTGRSRAGGGLG